MVSEKCSEEWTVKGKLVRQEEIRSSECYLGKGFELEQWNVWTWHIFNEERSVYDDRMTREERSLDLCGVMRESEVTGTWRSTPCSALVSLFFFLSFSDHAVDWETNLSSTWSILKQDIYRCYVSAVLVNINSSLDFWVCRLSQGTKNWITPEEWTPLLPTEA